MEGLSDPSLGMRRLGRRAGLVDPSSSSACFNHRCEENRRFSNRGQTLQRHLCEAEAGLRTFLQEPVVGGVSGSSLDRRLPVGTPGVVGLRFARNGDEKRT